MAFVMRLIYGIDGGANGFAKSGRYVLRIFFHSLVLPAISVNRRFIFSLAELFMITSRDVDQDLYSKGLEPGS